MPAQAEHILWWNVENLFDCQHDTLKDDYEFLPEGSHHWTPWRYWRKLDNIARPLAAVAAEDSYWPMLVGMCEVENDTVLRDMTKRSTLRTARYEYIHEEGPDERGVDVCLLYQKDQFRPLGHRAVLVPSAEHGLKPTRDILHVWGTRVWEGDTLHVLVCHFPSRASGTREADENRRLAARTLQSLLAWLEGKKVLVMGDFNANPKDGIFRLIYPYVQSLMPQSRKELRKAQGTYYFQKEWEYLDHMLASPELLPSIRNGKATIVDLPFLKTEKGVPFRTYLGPVYQGGFSDHLPIRVDLLSR